MPNKTGRPKAASVMKHTGIVLPEALLTLLRTEAGEAGRGLSAHIRHKLTTDLYVAPAVDTVKLVLVCDFQDTGVAEAIECAKELVEKARETGSIETAKVLLPAKNNEVDLA